MVIVHTYRDVRVPFTDWIGTDAAPSCEAVAVAGHAGAFRVLLHAGQLGKGGGD